MLLKGDLGETAGNNIVRVSEHEATKAAQSNDLRESSTGQEIFKQYHLRYAHVANLVVDPFGVRFELGVRGRSKSHIWGMEV